MRCLTDYCIASVNRYVSSIQWRRLYDFARDTTSPVREIWRLRLNFLVLMLLSFVSGIGYSSTLASFHQFITNPNEESLTLFNGTELHYVLQIHRGLFKSDFFYSWTIAVYSIGEIVFALVFGYATRWIPYWYLLLVGILAHTVGNIFYALATTGWMILVSRFLTGGYSGVIETIVYAYISEREETYQSNYAQKQEEYKSSNKQSRIKDHTYALHTFTVTLSYLTGPVLSAVVGQFPEVNQFRWVGWLNMALGMVSVVILVALFHGEYKSHNNRSKSVTKLFSKNSIQHLCQGIMHITKPSLIRISLRKILIFFLVTSYVMDSSYGVVDTLFNPILADYFGFTEKEISYFFIGAMVVYVLASLFLLLLNTMKLNIRLLAIASIIISIAGAAVMTDWQAIGNDPCTKYSLFHYPELLQSTDNITLQTSNECIEVSFNESDIRSQMHDRFQNYTRNEIPSPISEKHAALHFDCSGINETECLHCTVSASNHGCISYRINADDLCFEMSMEGVASVESEVESSTVCSISTLPFSACINIRNPKSFAKSELMKIKTAVYALTEEILKLQSSNLDVDSSTPLTARQACLQSEDNCYWNPLSRIAKTQCHSCPPICRSVSRSLHFAQFCIGVVIFVSAIPMARLALMVLISDFVDTEDQGPFTGFIVAAGGLSRAISPIWLDAAYEGVQKRTFLVMLIKIATFIPILLGLLVCYTQLIPKNKGDSNSLDALDEESSDTELLLTSKSPDKSK